MNRLSRLILVLWAVSALALGAQVKIIPGSGGTSGGGVWGTITGSVSDQTDLQSALDAKVPTTRTVNGHALSANATVTASDVGLGSVENAAASGLYVPLTRTVNGSALSSNVTVSTITGNAGTATALQNARTINGTSFDGTANITVPSFPYKPFTPSGDDDEFDNGSFTGWTAVNSGSHNPTITETNGVASFLLPGSDSTAELHAYMKAHTFSANDYIETCEQSAGINQNYDAFMLIAADGTTYNAGTQVTFGPTPPLDVMPFYSFTGYNAAGVVNQYSMKQGTSVSMHCWRLKWISANTWAGYVSPDGISWAQVGPNQTRTFTPTHFGFAMSAWGGTNQKVWSLYYVRFGNGS